jgi:DNA helicase-2/ATP-dependent DNA helicase PcrA
MASKRQDLQQYNEAFLNVLEGLNAQQRKAVEQIEGPVLVIAGPGTGKTHILSARIGRILMETDARAQNILCLTFTDAGVNAMRERLLQFIGPEAHRVHIYTFHSFCNTIIQDNLERFGRQDMEPISDLERVEIIRQILDGLPIGHPLRLGRNDPYFYENHLYQLFQKMKAESWSMEYLYDCIDEYLESLPQQEAFIYKVNRGDIRKGDLKMAKIEDEINKMQRLRAAVQLFDRYQQAMLKQRRYDYEDMILWVLQAFKEQEGLLRTYQEQYLYLLIDEYQDTNGAQNEIIRQLVSYWESPNLFIVGDDDQSIYEFQGARLKNLVDFYEDYKSEIALVVLADNYRSSQFILNASRELIEHNDLRIVERLHELGVVKELHARNEQFAQSSIKPKIVYYPNLLQEEAQLVSEVKALQEKGFPLDEVAIIYAQHRQAENLVALLAKNEIPYNLKRKVNILHLPLIRHFRQLMEYFQLEFQQPHSGAHQLYQMLHFTFLGIHPDDIATLSVAQASVGWENQQPWRKWLSEVIEQEQLSLKRPEAIRQFVEFLEQMHRDFASLSVPIFLERLLNRSGLLKYILEQPNKAWLIQAFKALMDFARNEALRQPRLTIEGLLETLHRMDSNRLSIDLNQAAYAEQGVNLLSAHSAKGLEFQRVYIFDCSSKYWEPRNRGGASRFKLPDTLTYSGEEDELEARRRLFYVGMTRAKEYLQLSYSDTDYKGKPQQPAIFINEIQEREDVETVQHQMEAEAVLAVQIIQLSEPEIPSIPAQDKALVDALLEGFQLSISAMSRYLRCPLAFYYENVLKVPVQMSAAAHYGTAMHYALQKLFERMKLHKDYEFPSASELISFFEQEMNRRRAFMEAKEYDKRLLAGRQHLYHYYQHYIGLWKKNVLLEYKPRNVEVEGVPITGSIDQVIHLDATYAQVSDYKTGSQSDSKLRRPTEKNPHGGTYWRQLVFYKLLYESYPANTRIVQKGTISYLEPNTKGEFKEQTISFNTLDVAQLKEMIVDTYQRIQAHDFYEGCGEASCSWCELLRHNKPIESFSAEDIESLDD